MRSAAQGMVCECSAPLSNDPQTVADCTVMLSAADLDRLVISFWSTGLKGYILHLVVCIRLQMSMLRHGRPGYGVSTAQYANGCTSESTGGHHEATTVHRSGRSRGWLAGGHEQHSQHDDAKID
jgi:hypothetical protein